MTPMPCPRGEPRHGDAFPFTRQVCAYTPPRPLEEIEAEVRELEAEIQGMLGEVWA